MTDDSFDDVAFKSIEVSIVSCLSEVRDVEGRGLHREYRVPSQCGVPLKFYMQISIHFGDFGHVLGVGRNVTHPCIFIG